MSMIQVIAQGTASQIYSRLVLAAMQQQVVFVGDLTPVAYGIHFTKMTDAHLDAMNEVIEALTQMDCNAGRPPVTALLISRLNGKYLPTRSYFQMVSRIYGYEITESDWEQLVDNVYSEYAVPNFSVPYNGQVHEVLSKMRTSYKK